MNRKLINWFGLTGIAALISYAVAAYFCRGAFPGYNWMESAVSDLSAMSAPSRQLWDQLSAVYSAGKQISSFQEVMHMIVTVLVVVLSIASLVVLIIAGIKNKEVRGIGIWAAIFFAMMMIGPIGMKAFPPEYFGIAERLSIYSAIGFNAVLGIYLFNGFNTNKLNKN